MIQREIFDTLKEEFNSSLDYLDNSEIIPCLLIIGRSHSGKEELIENMFGKPTNTPEKGIENYTIYRYENIEVINYDIEENHNFHDDLPEIFNMVNLAWYCGTAPMLIKKEWDFRVLDFVRTYLPTALIITSLKGILFPSRIKKLKEKIDLYYDGPVFPACIINKCTKESIYREDWEGLLSWSISELEDSFQSQMAVTAVSTDVLSDKKTFINNKIISSYTAGAAAIGAIPIPFSDAVLLIPEQVAMTMHILKLYGLEGSSRVITKIVRSTVLSQIGRMLTGSLVKIIPGIGSASGAAINGSVAASITWLLGRSVSEMAYRYMKSSSNGATGSFEEYFNSKGLNEIINELKNIEPLNKVREVLP